MISRLLQLALLLGVSESVLAAFGPAFSTGPVSDGVFIREAESTLIVPEGNSPFAGYLSLWVGMGTDIGHLIQTILDRHPGEGGSTICENIVTLDQWCGYPYTLENDVQVIGDQISVVAGDRFTYRYVYNDDSQEYEQFAIINGETKATMSTASGKAEGFGTAEECAETDCGTVPAHQWVDTVITLDPADPNYGNTAVNMGVTTSGFSTDDGGATWKVSTIDVPEFTFG